MKNRLLIVDDEPELMETLVDSFNGFMEPLCLDSLEKIELVELDTLGAAILDWSYDTKAMKLGLETLRKGKGDEFPILIYTGDIELNALDAYLAGASGIFRKPTSASELISFLENSLDLLKNKKQTREERVRIIIPALVNLGSKVIDALIINKSTKGCFLACSAELPELDQKVRLFVRDFEANTVELQGITKWVSPSYGHFPRGFGIELVSGTFPKFK